MMSSKNSQEYTYKAVESFNKHTKLRPIDKFILIDNDNSIDHETYGMTVIKNQSPKLFSENVNQVLSLAIQDKADFVLLNNDIIFTPNWLEPLINTDIIAIPLCNQYITEKTDKFQVEFKMDLSQYVGNEDELDTIAKKITDKNLKFDQPKLILFYCFYLPYNVSSNVGLFDENFENGGEDVDYRLRTRVKGYDTKLISGSYLLHFMGMSTWRSSTETDQQVQQRNKKYIQYFISKWGLEAANEYLDTSLSSFTIKIN